MCHPPNYLRPREAGLEKILNLLMGEEMYGTFTKEEVVRLVYLVIASYLKPFKLHNHAITVCYGTICIRHRVTGRRTILASYSRFQATRLTSVILGLHVLGDNLNLKWIGLLDRTVLTSLKIGGKNEQ